MMRRGTRCREGLGIPHPKKKSLEPNGPKDCTLVHLILSMGLEASPRAFTLFDQVGLLAHGSSYSPHLPSH
jgi:hypothetical protein